MHKDKILDATVELVSAFMQSNNASGLRTEKEFADQYAEFIDVVYNKVADLVQRD